MSAKAISEATGKDILNRHLAAQDAGQAFCRFATVNQNTDLGLLANQNPWLLDTVSRETFPIAYYPYIDHNEGVSNERLNCRPEVLSFRDDGMR